MAKTFNTIKKKVGLYDFLRFGKFNGCRVDSLLADEYEYLQYLKYEKIVQFDEAVLEALEDRLKGLGYEEEKDIDPDNPEELYDVPY